MKIKSKWKLFSIGNYFSNDLSSEQAEELFDKLAACETNAEVEVILGGLPDDETGLWSEFREMVPIELCESVEALARHAQEVEEAA